MDKTRPELQDFLESLMGNRNVYFQPPESFKMHYPAIRYSLSAIDNGHANNLPYLQTMGYQLIYITEDPDDEMIKTLSKLPLCRFERFYTSDNLNHYIFTLYY